MYWCFVHLLYNIIIFLNLASRFPNFFAIDWESVVVTSCHTTVMDPVIAVTLCNCTLAIGLFTIAYWTLRLRRQLVGLTDFCDRSLTTWNLWSSRIPAAADRIGASRSQLAALSQIYQQQLVTIDRLRTLRRTFRLARSVLRF